MGKAEGTPAVNLAMGHGPFSLMMNDDEKIPGFSS